MTILNFSNFGTFKILGKGYIANTANDGRAVFCKTKKEAKDAEGTIRGSLLGIHQGFVIQNLEEAASGDGFGFYVGDNLGEALEEYFRILSESGITITEEVS